MNIIKVKSTDNTDTIIFGDKIQYILQKEKGCIIGLDNGVCIKTSAKFKDIEKAIDRLMK